MEINRGKLLAHSPHTRRLDAGWTRWGGHKVEHEPGSGRFCGREHRLPLRIYCEDTDFSGVVYHGNYVRYLERGRSDFIRELGIGLSSLLHAERPVTFMVSRLDLRFMRPARIDDRLEVRTLAEVASGARVVCRQSILRGGETLIEAISENVCVGLDGRPRRLPAMFAQKIAPFLPNAVREAAEPAWKSVAVRELEAVG
jgi:acyl-CoA thioester hydrolase